MTSESKLKHRRHSQILSVGARCIYCGDPAATIDHMPPAVLFRYKYRPKGLEFASCGACNSGTAHPDLVAAFFARFSDNREYNEKLGDEAGLIAKAIENNIPGFFAEVAQTHPNIQKTLENINRDRPGFVVPGQIILHTGGPIVSRYLGAFAAKLGFALFYETTKTIVPPCGGVRGIWAPNLVVKFSGMSSAFADLFPEAGSTLTQGSVTVSDQFEYNAHVESKYGITIGAYKVRLMDGLHFAVFVSTEREYLAPHYPDKKLFVPGDFKKEPLRRSL